MLNNHVDALGDVVFSNYSHAHSGVLVDSTALTLAESGETIAHSEAEAFFLNLDLSELYTESSGVGSEGAFQGSATSDTQVVANFAVGAGETFSFDFIADLSVEAKEIDNPDVEYSEALLNIGFLILDTSDLDNIKLLDYGDISAYLVSSEQSGSLDIHLSENFTLDDYGYSIDIDEDNGLDFIDSTNLGTYERTVDQDTNITLVKVNNSAVSWLGDSLINNLGSDFTYGTIRDNRWSGTPQDDQYYASLGDDTLFGRNGDDLIIAGHGDDQVFGGRGDDTLKGGEGNDLLTGGNGNDTLDGSEGDDLLRGGRGDDTLFGNDGNDQILGGRGDDILLGGDGDDLIEGGRGDDVLLGGNGNNELKGDHGNDILMGGDGNDQLKGGRGDDILMGRDGDDQLKGARGDDTLTGDLGADQFIYQTSRVFNSSRIGVDLITDLEVNTDKIVLSQRTFNVLTPNIDSSINADEFEVVASDELAALSEAFITYSSSTGNLFYNQNGSDTGLGRGDQFATLQNIPIISTTDFLIIE